ncbi:MAG: XdhC family protein, partial [Pseudohongiellaceae bacterium]
SPRPIGSLLACNEEGQYCGSLSGGCVEDDLRESIFQGKLARDKPERIKYGVAVEDVMRLGLPCGGTLEVVVEPLKPDQSRLYRQLAEKINARQLITRSVDIDTGVCSLRDADEFAPLSLDGRQMEHTYGPGFQLLLIGAVQVAFYLAEMAQALDYHVEICDPRAELVGNAPVSNVPMINAMPDDWLREKTIDMHTAVIALCHDPRIDDMALMEVLHRDAFYIGAMGSARTSRKRRERLQLLDISETQIAKLHAPVGLDIGSKTPPEIAIAILAELTRLRATVRKSASA